MTTRKNFIDLSIGRPSHDSCAGTHRNPILVKGEGDSDYQFPTAQELVSRSLEKSGNEKPSRRRRRRKNSGNTPDNSSDTSASSASSALDLRGIFDRLRIIPTTTDEPENKLGETLVAGAEGLQFLMAKRQFDGLLDARFGPLVGAVSWARKNMEAKFQPSVESLGEQLEVMQERYKEALPMLVQELAKRNPGVPVPELFQHAIGMLDEQLAQILYILKVYTDCFGQYRDGRYAAELDAIAYFFLHAHRLMGSELPTSAFHVGDLYLARFTSMGLATIPGSRGPIGIHALQVPFNMKDILALMLPLFAHEFRHNIFHDVKGLEDELMLAVKNKITESHKTGKIKFKEEKIRLSRKVAVPTLDLIIKLMADTIGEIDADLVGGVQLSGPAYLYNMLLSFPAMLVNDGPISEAESILRTSSSYQLVEQKDGSKALIFAPHPPDYIRAHIVAAGLEMLGFKDEADQCRKLADGAVGKTLPEYITWVDGEGQSQMVVRIPVVDIKAAAMVVADALINTKLKALGGKSTGELVSWNKGRERKVRLLAQNLMDGSSDVPTDAGSMFATFVGAAATIAFWQKVHAGKDAVEAAQEINALALAMLRKLEAQEKAQVAPAPGQASETEGDTVEKSE